DKPKADETQSAGTNAFQMTNSVAADMSSLRRSCARALSGRMKSRRPAPGRDRPGRGAQLRRREYLLHRHGRRLDSLEQSWLRWRQVRPTRMYISCINFLSYE